MSLNRQVTGANLGPLLARMGARQELVEAVVQFQKGVKEDATALKDAPLDQTVRAYLKTIHNPHSHSTKRYPLEQLVSFMEDYVKGRHPMVSDLTKAAISTWFSGPVSARPITTATFGKYCKVVSAFCIWLQTQQMLKDNPVDGVERGTPDEGKPVALKPDEKRRLVQLASETDWASRNVMIVMFGLMTGARVGEIAKLRWGHLDLDPDTRSVELDGKYNKIRVMRMALPLANALLGYKSHLERRLGRKVGPDDAVFPIGIGFSRGQPMTVDGFETMMRKLMRKLGKPKGINFHCLRHTFAVDLMWKGAKLPCIQRALGHRHISTTMIYERLADPEVAAEIDRVYAGDDWLESVAAGMSWDDAYHNVLPTLEEDQRHG